MMPIRWLLLAAHVPPSGSGGGMVRYCVEMARAFESNSNVELHVLCAQPSMPFFEGLLEDRRRLHSIKTLPSALTSLRERAGYLGSASNLAFAVIHGAKHLVPRANGGGGRRLLTVHDMILLDRPADFKPAKRRLLRGPYLGSIKDAERIVCVSAATRERMCSYVPTAREKSVVVNLGVSAELVSAEPRIVEPLRGKRFALVVGDPSLRKNIALAVEVWPKLLVQHPDAILAIVGPPSWGPAQLGSIEAAKRGSVVVLGFLPDAELAWAYINAVVVLCPSLLEGFGLPAFEAAAFGATVVTSDDPALCEVSMNTAYRLPSRAQERWLSVLNEIFHRRRPLLCITAVRSWADVAAETIEAAIYGV